MIEIQNLIKRFGRAVAVDDVTLSIQPGESVALWGINGAGKTTILRCVLGLLHHRGAIRVAGYDTRRRGKLARLAVGYVPQEIGFYDELQVRDAVAFFARLRGVRAGSSEDALARVGLEGQGAKRIRELSGGMKQRLAVAVALLGDPRVLVLDEVTASLDAGGRGRFVEMLAGLIRSSHRATLFASHRVEEIAALATRVVTLQRGRVTGDIPVAEFLGSQGGGETLRVLVDPTLAERAIQVLRGRGFAARMNGHGVLVPVLAGGRAAPLHALRDAMIHVDDFEVLGKPCATGDEQ